MGAGGGGVGVVSMAPCCVTAVEGLGKGTVGGGDGRGREGRGREGRGGEGRGGEGREGRREEGKGEEWRGGERRGRERRGRERSGGEGRKGYEWSMKKRIGGRDEGDRGKMRRERREKVGEDMRG